MYAVDKFKLNSAKETSDFGSYTFGPFPKGYGVTFGNALRRILLSSIEGAAVTSIRIVGVKHEYTTIPGVIDDVLTILLRIKQLAFKSFSNEPQEISLTVKGKKKVTAKDIKLTSEVEISNPDLAITELTDPKAKLEIKMIVEKGIGYRLGDDTKRSEVGVIPIDSNFSPVKRVVMNVTKTRVGQETDLDQVELEISTNGAIAPKTALEQAALIYSTLTARILSVIKGEASEEKPEAVEQKADSSSSDLDIDKLNLSARLTNSLLKAGYKNLTELQSKTMEDLLEIRGLGQKSVEELIEIMKSYKLKIGS